MTDQELQQALQDQLLYPNDEAGFADYDAELVDASTFAEAGVMTRNAGLVLRFADGSEFQVTLVQSRQGDESSSSLFRTRRTP